MRDEARRGAEALGEAPTETVLHLMPSINLHPDQGGSRLPLKHQVSLCACGSSKGLVSVYVSMLMVQCVSFRVVRNYLLGCYFLSPLCGQLAGWPEIKQCM